MMKTRMTNGYDKMRKVGAFRASLRLLRDPHASVPRKMAIIGATMLGVIYIIAPDPTDIIPVLGLLDEATVAIIIRFVLAWLAEQYRRTP